MKKKIHFAKILKQYNYKIHPGDVVAGTILHNEKSGFLVEIGTEKSGYLPKEELTLNLRGKNKSNLVTVITTRDFFLIAENKRNKQYILSLKRLDYIRAWKRIKQMYGEDIIFNLNIEHINKGGFITYLEGIQGFIPKSHICTNDDNENLYQLKNQQIRCKLLSFNENKNQLILSNKSAKYSMLKHKFKLGELIYGKIISKKAYGVFLNINNIRALLHKSEIIKTDKSYEDIILEKNSFIKIKIIYLNTREGLISVSIKNVNFSLSLLPQY